MDIQKFLALTVFFSVYLFLSSYVTVSLNLYLKNRKKPRKKKNKLVTVKNSKVIARAKNDVSEFQKIKTSEIVLPVIKATVLEYAPGDLGETFPEKTLLYYSPESISDSEFLESVIRSPLQVETHEKNTSEFNRSVDGWNISSWFDEKDKTVYARGYLIGKDNIEYAKENQNTPSFGTSAFISFLKIDKENGKTPEGLEYNAIARKAVCNHVAILPNIRDEKNKIVSINAKNAVIENSKNIKGVKNSMEQSEFNALMEKYNEEKNAKNEEMEKIVNAVLERIEGKGNSKNEDKPEEKKPEPVNEDKPEEKAANEEKPEEKAANEEKPEEKKEEAANALPSETLVKTFADFYGVRFTKTPTVKQLAELAEIPYETFPKALNALKKKASEILSEMGSATNSNENKKSITEVLKEF